MRRLIYIHGFNSSPQSEKAQITKAYFSQGSSSFELEIAEFPPQPRAAMEHLTSIFLDSGSAPVAGVIGSSLGGYYALYLHVEFGVPAAIINPALRPYELLTDYLGVNENLYTGEQYVVTRAHMDELRALDRVSKVRQDKVYLLTQTGDEVLDYQQALDLLPRAKSWIGFGGDHAFQDFNTCLPSIENFFTAT